MWRSEKNHSRAGNGEGNGTPLQYSCLANPMDRGAWWVSVHGTWLSDFTFPFHFHALEKEMATHSSVLALGIPGTGEPSGLPSMGSHRVGHNWSDLAAAAAAGLVRQVSPSPERLGLLLSLPQSGCVSYAHGSRQSSSHHTHIPGSKIEEKGKKRLRKFMEATTWYFYFHFIG